MECNAGIITQVVKTLDDYDDYLATGFFLKSLSHFSCDKTYGSRQSRTARACLPMILRLQTRLVRGLDV